MTEETLRMSGEHISLYTQIRPLEKRKKSECLEKTKMQKGSLHQSKQSQVIVKAVTQPFRRHHGTGRRKKKNDTDR